MIRQKLVAAGSVMCSVTFLMCAALTLTAGPKPDTKGDVAKGKEAFEQCAICHNVDNDEKKMGPSLKGLYKRKTLASGKPVNDANVLAQINAGGNGMPAYSDMLSADDKANILAYLHTL
jgi:cytochrome c2